MNSSKILETIAGVAFVIFLFFISGFEAGVKDGSILGWL